MRTEYRLLQRAWFSDDAEVFHALAHHTSLEMTQPCTIQLMRAPVGDGVNRWREEARRGFALAHNYDGLLTIFSVGMHEGRPFLVMEDVSGASLSTLRSHFAGDGDMVRYVAFELLMTLDYLHENNVLHGDLRLENIIATVEGEIKVSGLGQSLWAHNMEAKQLDLMAAGEILQHLFMDPDDDEETRSIPEDLYRLIASLRTGGVRDAPAGVKILLGGGAVSSEKLANVVREDVHKHRQVALELPPLVTTMTVAHPMARHSEEQKDSEPCFVGATHHTPGLRDRHDELGSPIESNGATVDLPESGRVMSGLCDKYGERGSPIKRLLGGCFVGTTVDVPRFSPREKASVAPRPRAVGRRPRRQEGTISDVMDQTHQTHPLWKITTAIAVAVVLVMVGFWPREAVVKEPVIVPPETGAIVLEHPSGVFRLLIDHGDRDLSGTPAYRVRTENLQALEYKLPNSMGVTLRLDKQ